MEFDLKKYFERYDVKYVEHKHMAVFTVNESRELKKKIPGLHCKTLFLKDSNGKFYLIGLPAEKRLDTKSLKKYLGVRKLNFGSEEELKNEVKLVPGSVSIFGIIHSKNKRVKIIIDEEVWLAEKVGFHPNKNTSTLEINHKDLEKFWDSLKCEKDIISL